MTNPTAQPLTILFSSAGRRVQLMECFRMDAAQLGIRLRVIAVDANPELSPACQVADQAYAVPRCLSAEFAPRLLEICAQERVSLVIPTIDTELEVMAAQRECFQKQGVEIAVSAPAVVQLARNKLLTAQFFQTCGVPSARTAELADLFRAPEAWRWPVVLKKIGGSSSVGVYRAERIEQVSALVNGAKDYLVQELLTGREYTVNMYFDRAGSLRCAVPHLRQEIRAGEVSKGLTVRHEALEDAARRLAAALPGARGALCFQAIDRPDHGPALFEINARFGGGFPLSHRAGALFSKWLLEEVTGRTSSANNEWLDGVEMLRYDTAVFQRRGKRL